jgi:sec-independent protein translocase protein TatB
MFDIGFLELIVVGIVALIVVGPERLPRVARTVGLLLGRLQRYVGDVKADIGRELQLQELKKLQAEMQESVHDFKRGINDEVQAIEQSVDSIKTDIQHLSAPSSDAAPTPDRPDEEPAALARDASLPADKE